MAKRKATGTREWASHNMNIQRGCEHDCLYCYAHANAKRFKQVTDETSDTSWTKPRISMPPQSKYCKKFDGTVMFPTTHDITPSNCNAVVSVLRMLLHNENDVLLVTKPHLDCVKWICRDPIVLPLSRRILWRFTIGSTNSYTLAAWEPGAPNFEERLQSLAFAWAHGFRTSVSCEPLLTYDIEETRNLVRTLKPFVTDSIWLGRANHLMARVSMNKPEDPKAKVMVHTLNSAWTDDRVACLYEHLKYDPAVKWKNSIKEVVGIPLNDVDGLDK